MNVVMYFTNKNRTFKNHIIKIEIQMINKNDLCNKICWDNQRETQQKNKSLKDSKHSAFIQSKARVI